MWAHEWRRYFARLIDISVLSVPIGMLFRVFPQVPYLENAAVIFIISVFLWVFVESFLLSVWGTTPGKFLYKINLQSQGGERITFSRVLRRSFAVWFRGLGCGIPLIIAITMIVANRKLVRRGVTSWDNSGGFSVTHHNIGFLRWLTILLVITLIFLATSFSEVKTIYESVVILLTA